MSERFDAADREAILRRALELASSASRAADDTVDDDALIAIGGEVGLTEADVRRAIAEHALQSGPPDTVLVSRLLGSSSRCRAGDVERADALDLIDRHLQRTYMRRLHQRTPRSAEWHRRDDLVARAALTVGGLTGSRLPEIGDVRVISARVVEVDQTTRVVALTADLRDRRARHALAAASGLAGSATAGVAAVALSQPLVALGLPLGIAVAVGARTLYTRLERRVDVALEALLTAARAGDDAPPSPQDATRAAVRRITRRGASGQETRSR